MALAFYVTDYMNGKNGNKAVALALRDTSASTKDIPASFSQTQELTSLFVGVTEYGTLITNSQTSAVGETNVTLVATENATGSVYSAASIPLMSLLTGFWRPGESVASAT